MMRAKQRKRYLAELRGGSVVDLGKQPNHRIAMMIAKDRHGPRNIKQVAQDGSLGYLKLLNRLHLAYQSRLRGKK